MTAQIKDYRVYPGKYVNGVILCQCPGCSEEHLEGEQCPDKAAALYAVVGDIIRGVCVECLIELAKKLL